MYCLILAIALGASPNNTFLCNRSQAQLPHTNYTESDGVLRGGRHILLNFLLPSFSWSKLIFLLRKSLFLLIKSLFLLIVTLHEPMNSGILKLIKFIMKRAKEYSRFLTNLLGIFCFLNLESNSEPSTSQEI